MSLKQLYLRVNGLDVALTIPDDDGDLVLDRRPGLQIAGQGHLRADCGENLRKGS